MMTDDTYAAYQFYTLLFISGCLHVCIHYLIEEKKKQFYIWVAKLVHRLLT